ncbi:protein trichome birefringence-like 25 [Andrographis paniculata]|uniref:protein trichome birefringence-like 25 n=1 Tax=Andrographis paniculata TaxID=175694 RepID=UPI0021E90FC1|nr:protein trichome birefringence-like 25 [Andrographis paniculata]
MKQQLGSPNIQRKILSSVLVKFAVCFLLLTIGYRLLSSTFIHFSPLVVSEDDPQLSVAANTSPPPAETSEDASFNPDHYASQEGCNLFVGDWVPDSDGPVYTNTSCSTIEPPQNCMKNGRPDRDYVFWRWNPRGCSLPRLDPKKFLDVMKAKSLAFIGDSIMRNHVQSLLCLLSQAEQSVEVYHDTTYKNRRWSFPSHGFNVSLVWAPFLTKALTFEDENGVSSGITQLYLDEPDTTWTQQYEKFDHVIIAGGKWFLKSAIYYENKTVVGCHNCHNNNITEMEFEHAYRKALNSTLKFITGSKHRPSVLFRTTTPDHFENGEWDTGGYCNRTRPFKAGEAELNVVDKIMRRAELEEFGKAAARGSENGVTLKLLDTTALSLMRPDGHPGVYRQFHPYEGKDENAKIQNDCLHWCLPGPIDTWNDLMMEMLLLNRRRQRQERGPGGNE